MPIRTFLDANVLIAAFRGTADISKKALEVIDDPQREFVVSDYLCLEILPKPTFFKKTEECQFMEFYMNNATLNVPTSPFITNNAIKIGAANGLGAMDALHVATAIDVSVDEFITLEKPEKPIFRVNEIQIKYLES